MEATDWSNLSHQKGYATDTPGHLRALIGSDVELQRAALDHIAACMGKMMIWPASPVAALVVLGILLEPNHQQTIDPIRKELEAFILRVIELGSFISPAEHAELMRCDKTFKLTQKRYAESVKSGDLLKPHLLKLLVVLVSNCLKSKLIKLILKQPNLLNHPAFLFDIINLVLTKGTPSPSELFLSNPDTLFNPQLLFPREHVLPEPQSVVPKPTRKQLPPDKLTPPEP